LIDEVRRRAQQATLAAIAAASATRSLEFGKLLLVARDRLPDLFAAEKALET
jgi:hypothetical protein